MARIYSEEITVTISTLVKDQTQEVAQLVNETLMSNLEDIVQELVGEGLVVEVYRKE